MSEAFEIVHMNHINAMVEDFDASVDHLADLYGAQFNLDLPGPHWHACLVTIGGVMFEVFAPTEYLLTARLGPHYVGVEYQVDDVDAARTDVVARSMRVVRELGSAFHVHPAEAFGVAWEFFNRSFQDPDDPPVPYTEPLRTSEYWRREHPVGYLGLKRYSVVVADLKTAREFFEDFLGARVVYETARPLAAARGVGLQVGDTIVELLTPSGAGSIERYLARYGDGIRSVVFAVADLDGAQRHFAEHGARVRPGDADDSFAIGPEGNLGLLFEFSE